MGEAVFMHYDREALDREYDNRAKVPDAMDYLARYARESERTREGFRCELDIPYGQSRGERLDVFFGDPGSPVQVFIHGGYWRSLGKSDFSYVHQGLAPAGVTTVVIDYDLVPAVSLATLVEQCRRALEWVYRNIASRGGDPGAIHVSGHSAGGHLVGMLFATDWPSRAGDLPADLLKSGAGISGLYDLEPLRLSFLNADLRLDRDEAERLSPFRLPRFTHAPLWLPVGELEGPEYIRQSRMLAAAWEAHEGGRWDPVEVDVIPGHHHFSIAMELGDYESVLAGRLLALMDQP